MLNLVRLSDVVKRPLRSGGRGESEIIHRGLSASLNVSKIQKHNFSQILSLHQYNLTIFYYRSDNKSRGKRKKLLPMKIQKLGYFCLFLLIGSSFFRGEKKDRHYIRNPNLICLENL